MVRFIIGCMLVVVIALAAIPGMKAVNGIVAEHAKSLELASRHSKEIHAEVAMEQDAVTADELNNLATAAGTEEKDYGTEEIKGGFANSAPAGFNDPVENELQ